MLALEGGGGLFPRWAWASLEGVALFWMGGAEAEWVSLRLARVSIHDSGSKVCREVERWLLRCLGFGGIMGHGWVAH